MRIAVGCTLVGFGLLACAPPPRYLNADEVVFAPTAAARSTPCNELVQQGEDVDLRGSRAPAPKPAGGVVEDGTYVLTSSTVHTKDQPDGAKLVGMGKVTMLVEGSIAQVVRNTVNGHERRTTVERATSGAVSTLRTTCAFPTPGGSDPTLKVTYTATSSSLQFITPGPAGTVVATYTKVPSSNMVSRGGERDGHAGL